MNEQIITEVLNDILEELKQSNQSLKTLQITIGDLQEKTTGFEQKLTKQQVIAPPADTTSIEELTGRAINTIQQDVKKQCQCEKHYFDTQAEQKLFSMQGRHRMLSSAPPFPAYFQSLSCT